jgi:hypothetical protein
VVPDNCDPTLTIGRRDPAFWDKVRAWAAKGWTIAMHGHTHVMRATNAKLLVPFYQRSEFAGLPLEEQCAKIRAAWQRFLANNVSPEVWVAPAHSFDTVTLEALRRETSITVVSDGIACDPFWQHGFHWVPQQVWGRLARRPPGLWTVCLHPNGMSEADIASLDQSLSGRFGAQMTSLAGVRLTKRRKSLLGRLYHQYFWWRWRSRQGAALSGGQKAAV